ncbi:bifunctional DNA-formamidopyrimidine glycosylase/DNA-(apurinic or apyrimidinic site) lyase [Methylotenera mobilis]|uniref:Formamidopyrimidine-DNA glycosylase n=1 Tax=Methylotenera mobilis (strain JLW8 / ATCC BAA-1282 / DSM 17540) TaxID=583345 RepID=C6WXS7_METML|nr:bifunctional DNA-formamidopyrimidine glycosylase/DNA-(apurinic or apyrimidinic site) lyase [Methylotenera mobilis]ACT48726.1 formamidopyrimidine-DNA glycosylase [Methylotenera mobilis JLW8]
MPELPEVETTRLGLLSLVEQTVAQVVIRNPSLRWPIPDNLADLLQGQTLRALTRRAKYILAHFDHGVLLLHLGMSGRICLLAKNETAQKHDHFDLVFTDGQVLRLRDPRRFGAVLWAGEHYTQHKLLSVLGPEPLDDAFTGAYLQQHIRTRTAAIKTTIMDGHLVVGVGNIYASESLFRARINPATPANKLNLRQCETLVAEIKATLSDALKAGGSSLRDFFGTDGNPGYFQQQYFVYGRTGEPCRVCGKHILNIKQGQRSTFYCGVCQKL